VELCPDRFVSHVPPFQWQKLLAAVREESEEAMLTEVAGMQVCNPSCTFSAATQSEFLLQSVFDHRDRCVLEDWHISNHMIIVFCILTGACAQHSDGWALCGGHKL
jgi:hypothetical protein